MSEIFKKYAAYCTNYFGYRIFKKIVLFNYLSMHIINSYKLFVYLKSSNWIEKITLYLFVTQLIIKYDFDRENFSNTLIVQSFKRFDKSLLSAWREK